MTNREQLLDIEEAAEFLKVSETSLRRWTNSGRLACLRVGRRRERRFRRADLLAFMEDQPAVAAAPRGRDSGPTSFLGGIPVSHGTHVCGLYNSDQGRVRHASEFLLQGLRSGSVCFLVAAPEVRRGVLAAVSQSHPTLKNDVTSGRVVLTSYQPTKEAQHDYWEESFVTATNAGARSMHVVGDVSGAALAKPTDYDAAAQYERDYHQSFTHRFPLVTLCLYDVRQLSGVGVSEVLKCHQDCFRYPAELLVE